MLVWNLLYNNRAAEMYSVDSPWSGDLRVIRRDAILQDPIGFSA